MSNLLLILPLFTVCFAWLAGAVDRVLLLDLRADQEGGWMKTVSSAFPAVLLLVPHWALAGRQEGMRQGRAEICRHLGTAWRMVHGVARTLPPRPVFSA